MGLGKKSEYAKTIRAMSEMMVKNPTLIEQIMALKQIKI